MLVPCMYTTVMLNGERRHITIPLQNLLIRIGKQNVKIIVKYVEKVDHVSESLILLVPVLVRSSEEVRYQS